MAKKKASKPRRVTAVDRAATCSQSSYPFVNNQGKIIWIEGETTIPELLKMGVKNISFEPKGSPMPEDKRIYVHAVTEDDSAQTPRRELKKRSRIPAS